MFPLKGNRQQWNDLFADRLDPDISKITSSVQFDLSSLGSLKLNTRRNYSDCTMERLEGRGCLGTFRDYVGIWQEI